MSVLLLRPFPPLLLPNLSFSWFSRHRIPESSKLPPLSSLAPPPNCPSPILQGPGIGKRSPAFRLLGPQPRSSAPIPISSKSRKEGLSNTEAENMETLRLRSLVPQALQEPWPPKLGIKEEFLRCKIESPSPRSLASKTGIWVVFPPPGPCAFSPSPVLTPSRGGEGMGESGAGVGGGVTEPRQLRAARGCGGGE